MWTISFITEEQFKEHIRKTIRQYGVKLKPYDIKKINQNIIDPVKMVFDRAVYRWSWEELIASEVFRQRDKANTNDIGYFHQRIFEYMNGCHVPDNGKEGGWDVIVSKPDGYCISDGNTVHTVYVEMKNKHNTMNAASAERTYTKMQKQILKDDDCACFLVEVIAKKHQNIAWKTTIDGQKNNHQRIRRVSIDSFYEIVTGQADAFYQICKALPVAVQDALSEQEDLGLPEDTVFAELKERAKQYPAETEDIAIQNAIYLLGFSDYTGFK